MANAPGTTALQKGSQSTRFAIRILTESEGALPRRRCREIPAILAPRERAIVLTVMIPPGNPMCIVATAAQKPSWQIRNGCQHNSTFRKIAFCVCSSCYRDEPHAGLNGSSAIFGVIANINGRAGIHTKRVRDAQDKWSLILRSALHNMLSYNTECLNPGRYEPGRGIGQGEIEVEEHSLDGHLVIALPHQRRSLFGRPRIGRQSRVAPSISTSTSSSHST